MPDVDPSLDPAAARAERRLALLEEVTEIGMRLLRQLDERKADDPESADAYARISRAVRLTLALEEKTDRFLAELKAGLATTRPEPAPAAAEPRHVQDCRAAWNARKANAWDLVVAVSESETESLDSFEALLDALTEPQVEAGVFTAPHWDFRPAIERFCRAVGLSPELSDKVCEGWHAGYLSGRPRFNPWRGASAPVPPAPA
jgi:hypothetical protein